MADSASFSELKKTFEQLLGPNGCPWDKKQTHDSLKPYAIEEVYELLEAIEKESDHEIKNELGDVLLQVMLHSQIAEQRGGFDVYDVIQNLNEKMIRRHPHVFADVEAVDPEAVTKNWEQIKAEENANTASDTKADPFAGIPKALPALQRSYKIGKKSIRYNFDWSNVDQVLEKVDEELAELREAIANDEPKQDVALELGDILFTLAQVGRKLDIDPEQALRATNNKFETRFKKMRELSDADGHDFSSLKIEQLEAYWVKAKKLLRGELPE